MRIPTQTPASKIDPIKSQELSIIGNARSSAVIRFLKNRDLGFNILFSFYKLDSFS